MDNDRNKAWRQAKKECKKLKEDGHIEKQFTPEKNWKLMYIRSKKLKQAKQLGIDYPPITLRQKLDDEMPIEDSNVKKILFICSRNQWRSPTGEQVWKNHPELNVRSAGTSPKAKRTVNVKDIQWADVIFVMEEKHKNRLKAEFTRLLNYKEIQVLDIPDDYQYMDSELVEIMQQTVGSYLSINPLIGH
ncbi:MULTISPECIES: low molecular weight protein tyrosine phosphatase family protein [unclassified Shewanella]|uniref:low molecular weight protein tyrosine phosphatase family protein n=1 Tax=unclassified Shewanella TaxID=196818 RepID=UPI003553187D